MAKEKQRLSTGKRGPQERLRPDEDVYALETLPEKSFRQIEIEALATGEPAMLGLETLLELIAECREARGALHAMEKDDAYYNRLYKVSNSLSGLARTMLEFSRFVTEHNQLREHAKQEIYREVQLAFKREPDLAQRVTEFMDQTLID